MPAPSITRREFLRDAAIAGVGMASRRLANAKPARISQLATLGYGDVTLHSPLHQRQFENCRDVLMGLNEDSLLRPFRQMAGLAAPGEALGGWYVYKADYDYRKDNTGFAPGATFGQWVSALARMYAVRGDPAIRDRVLRLNRIYAQTVADGYFEKNRFPAYCYDKLTCGLIDSHAFAADAHAFDILHATTKIALPHLPGKAIPHDQNWRPGKDISWDWDESYTVPENQFLAYQRGAGTQYRELGIRYLDDEEYFDPLAQGKNVLAGKHAYSYVNALSSAMQAYLTLGSERHLRAATNAFDILTAQSFATGGWGPDEKLRATGSDDVAASLTQTHNSFETPCGAYAHFKLTRYLLMATRDSRYGDSMERVMYNTVLGAKPLRPDGSTFYYSDYHFQGRKAYHNALWPCCSGTLPQVAADYGINAYLRDDRSIYVNLYIPSTARWKLAGSTVTLTQRGTYPLDGEVQFEVKVDHPCRFELHLRIPAWAKRSAISINGKRNPESWMPGRFAAVRREWKNGDRMTLELVMENRLESISPQHPDTVALLRGPLALFAIGDSLPAMTRQQIGNAQRSGSQSWQAQSAKGLVTLLPFFAIADEPYSLYVRTA